MRSLPVVLLLVLGGLCQAGSAIDAPSAGPPGNSVPFRLRNGYAILATAFVAGRRVNALIDTGVNPTVIDRGLARWLQVPETDTAEVPTVQFGPVERRKVVVRVRDLQFIKPYLGVQVEAIIGMDVLAAMSFTIDYQKRQIVYGRVDSSEPGVAFVSGPPLATVEVAIGDRQFTLLLDSGTQGVMLFKSRADTGGLAAMRRVTGQLGRNLERMFPIHRLLLQHVQLGDTKLAINEAVISEDWPEWDGSFDGLCGISAMRFKSVTFDFASGMFRWKR